MWLSTQFSAFATTIVVLLCPLALHGQSDERPLSTSEVIRAVELGVSEKALIKQIENRGICFRVDDAQLVQWLKDGKKGTTTSALLFALNKAKYSPPVNAWFGASVKNHSQGVVVTFVYPDSPAQAAGIRSGDHIVTVNGQLTEDSEVFVTLVRAGRIGQASPFELIRDSQPLKLDVQLAQMPDEKVIHESIRTFADQGDVEAQVLLARNLFFGVGVDTDIPEAVTWTKKAADAGAAEAQTNLAEFLMLGVGVDKDMTQAVVWLRKAAEQNDPRGQRELAFALVKGDGTPVNNGEARKYALLAAGQGDGIACRLLGAMSENGSGTSVDRVQAIKWYRQAAQQGDEFSASALQRLGADK